MVNSLPQRPRWLIPATVGAIAILLVVSVMLWRQAGLLGSSTASGGPAIGGPFTLTDQHGQPVTDQNYHGRLMLVYFGYTFCPDVCPTTLARIGQGLDQLSPAQEKQVAPIFITIDPARDTQAQMAQYVPNFHPDLIGLTGTPDQILQVEKEYHVYAKKVDEGSGNYLMDHSAILYLMDKDGHYLALINEDFTPSALADTLKKYM